MKTILQKKDTSKPSPKEIERVQLGCAIMQAQFQLMGYYSYLVYKIHVIIKLWHIVQILNNEH